MLDVLIIGAGQAGLATAHTMQQSGLSFLVLEATSRAAGSWPSYYDSLTLFSPARYSSLPGLPFPGDPDRYPARDEVIAYLESYAKHFALPVVFNARVEKIERDGMFFTAITEKQECFHARAVLVASGPFNQPNIPRFPGLDDFRGQVLHSSAYRRPNDIQGTCVAVVGAGNSAVQIAYELSQTHQVILTSREPPRLMSQRPFGKDVHFWLTKSGLDRLPLGARFKWNSTAPVLDQGIYRQAFQDGRLIHKPLFDRITASGLQWGDKVQPIDSLLMATGFINQPSYLAGLDGLDAATASQQRGGVALHCRGLYFVGVSWQRSNASATLRGVGADAKYVARHLRRYLGEGKAGRLHWQGCC